MFTVDTLNQEELIEGTPAKIPVKSYTMELVVGDWSGDGHEKSDNVTLISNIPVADVQESYLNACKITNVAFHHGVYGKGGPKESYPNQLFTEYEDYAINLTCKALLLEHGIPGHLLTIGDRGTIEWFTELWIAFVKIGNPKINLTVLEKDVIPKINGYYGDLNCQFGYGLY